MHKKFLLATLAQARLGRGLCAPNPAVGAVAVQNGEIIAKAYHHGAGTLHAEPLVLNQIPVNTPGVSLYVSLEPCNHWGRTPPCVDAIIRHGIKEVFFAYADPNPVVSQKNSTELLKASGIKVTHYPLKEIDDFYKSYRYWTVVKKPWVTVKMAQTLNGKIGRSTGQPVRLSNALCEQFTHMQRATTDVILTTAKTVHCDNPQLNVRLTAGVQAKPVAIIDPRLSLDEAATLFTTAKHCHIFHCLDSQEQKKVYPNSTLYSMPKDCHGTMDLDAVLRQLGALGYHDVWVEAGGTLFTSLHLEGLVHKTYLYLVPRFLESGAISAYQGKEVFDRPHTLSWQAMDDNMIACIDWLEPANNSGLSGVKS